MKLFDSHCHLDDEKFNIDREILIERLFKEGIERLITAGYSLDGSKAALEIAKSYPRNICNLWNITK
ncbi:MAG: hypothetical protein HFJ58_03060 [Clostridia bacterium]|nr:hypothetical protein [Clostridia bacterium]